MFSLISNLFQWLFSKSEVHILVLGLDAAGKTTFLEQAKALLKPNGATSSSSAASSSSARHAAANAHLDRIAPTVGLNIARIDISSTRVILWDLGGQSLLRGIWSKYYSDCNGLIFIVDSCSSPERLEEARDTLRGIAAHVDLAKVPFLLCANKQDHLAAAASPQQVDDALLFSERCAASRRQHAVRGVSAITGQGVESALQWIVDAAKEFGPRSSAVPIAPAASS